MARALNTASGTAVIARPMMRGVHAALWTQQLTAQRQLEELQAAAARERTAPSTAAPYL